MTTSVSANCKLPSHHRIFSINYLHVLMGNYIAFFYEISCLIATTFRIQINAAYFLNFRPCVRSFYLLRVGWFNEKILVQESVVLVFHRCLYNKQNITCPLVVRTSIFSCSSRCFTCSLGSLVRYRLEHSKIKYSRLLDDESQSKPLHVGQILAANNDIVCLVFSIRRKKFPTRWKTSTASIKPGLMEKIIYGMKSFSIRQKKIDTIGSEIRLPQIILNHFLCPVVRWRQLTDRGCRMHQQKINNVYKSFKLKGERLDFIFLQRLQLFSTPSLSRTVLISRSHRRIFSEFIEKSIEKIHREIGCSKHA